MGLPPGDFSLLKRFLQCGQVATEVEMWNINKAESFILRNYIAKFASNTGTGFLCLPSQGKVRQNQSYFYLHLALYSRRELTDLYYSELLPLCLILVRNLIFASDQILNLYAEWNCPN